MKDTKVKTANGTTALLSNCVVDYQGSYRLKEECFSFRNNYFPKDHPDAIIDIATGTLGMKQYLIRAVESFELDDKGNCSKIVYCYTSSKYLPEFYTNDGNIFKTISIDYLLEKGFEENLKAGIFQHPKYKIPSSAQFNYLEANFIKKPSDSKLTDYKYGINSPTYLITEGLTHTFGVEIETSSGVLPNYFGQFLNYKTMRDGSVSAGEYVTGVLKGDKGFENLQNLTNELAKRTTVDKKCGLHVHIGGASFNETFIVAAYKLGLMLEKELYAILPPSRRNNEYCRALPKMNFDYSNLDSSEDLRIRTENYYNEIFILLAKTPPTDRVNKFTNHPKGARCGYDHSTPRYCWLNFVPAVFNTKQSNEEPRAANIPAIEIDAQGNHRYIPAAERRGAVIVKTKSSKTPVTTYTLEFRSHSGTTNFTKIKNWIKICMAFTYFADNYYSHIFNGYINKGGEKLPITLENMLKIVYPKSYESLLAYVEKRKTYFNSNDSEVRELDEYAKVKKESIKNRSIKELTDRKCV